HPLLRHKANYSQCKIIYENDRDSCECGCRAVSGKKASGKSGELDEKLNRIRQGGAQKYHQKLKEEGKLFARERMRLLLDKDSEFIEDALFANCGVAELPADGVITGIGKIEGRSVCIMANDATVKAGSWGKRTVEKILRIQETAMRL